MNDTITVVGNLATPPETKHLPDGTPVTSFRLASSRRKFDTGAGRFVDVDTDLEMNKPQLNVEIDREKAAALA